MGFLLIYIYLFSIITINNYYIGDFMDNEIKNNVPLWLLESESSTEQNDTVGNIVGGYIGAFRKRNFTQLEIGSLMTSAFLLTPEEVECRLDAVLSCAEPGEEESARRLCVYLAQKGSLFSNNDTDPCGIIEILKGKYGKTAAFETLLTFPQLLEVWKKAEVRELPQNAGDYREAQSILKECAQVFSEIC